MATQNDGFPAVNFSITSPFQNVRLMEVPEDVLSIIEAGRQDKSKNAVLKFKSAPSSSKAKDSILHICSDNKAWAIKQVSTSNSVYLIQPDSSHGSITATSKVGNFLELYPVQIDEGEIETAIAELLPVHTQSNAEEDPVFQAQQTSKQDTSLDNLITNIAFPDSIVRRICARLCVFEVSQRCYVPAASALLTTWAKVTETCAIEMIRLDHAINEQRIVDALTDPVETAIARAMLSAGGMFEQRGLFESTTETGVQMRYLKPEETCRFVATLLVRDTVDTDKFISMWMDLVPSSFAKYCTVDLLGSAGGEVVEYSREMDGPLFSHIKPEVAMTKQDNITANASTTASSKRKWHEKFGAQRSSKK